MVLAPIATGEHPVCRLISTAGCTILGGVHPVCARFLSHLLLLDILGWCMEQFPDAQFYGKCTLRVHKIKASFRTLAW